MSEQSKNFIGKSRNFIAYKCCDRISLFDIDERCTSLNKQDLKELIELLQKCEAQLKE